jgi:hypothetical protein
VRPLSRPAGPVRTVHQIDAVALLNPFCEFRSGTDQRGPGLGITGGRLGYSKPELLREYRVCEGRLAGNHDLRAQAPQAGQFFGREEPPTATTAWKRTSLPPGGRPRSGNALAEVREPTLPQCCGMTQPAFSSADLVSSTRSLLQPAGRSGPKGVAR